MENQKKTLFLKRFLGIFAGSILLIAVIAIFLQSYLRTWMDKNLREVVRKSSDGLYLLDYDDLSVSLLAGSASVEGGVLTTDSLMFASMVERKTAPDMTWDVTFQKLELEGVSVLKLLLYKSLSIDELKIDKPKVITKLLRQPFNKNKIAKTPYDLIKKALNVVNVGKIGLLDADFQLIDRSRPRVRVSHLHHLTADLSDFLINKNSESDSQRVFMAQKVGIRIDSLTLPYGDSLYTFSMTDIKLNSEDSSFQVAEIFYKPRFGREQFARMKGIAVDQFDLFFKKVACRGVDLNRFLTTSQFFSKMMVIQGGKMDIFRDTRYQKLYKNKMGTYPHQILLNSDVTLHFDTVRIRDVEVRYGELSPKTGKRGAVVFRHTKGYLSNLTNDSIAISKNKICRADVNTRFMGVGDLYAYFRFDLKSKKGDFVCGGKMRDFPMNAISPVTRPLALSDVQSGQISQLDFEIHADDYRSSLIMKMLYSKLYVAVLKMDWEERKLKKRSVVSNLINNLILDDNNPKGNRPARVANITLEREPGFSFFSFIWKTTLKGIKTIVTGAGKVEDQPAREKSRERKKRNKADPKAAARAKSG